MFAKALILALAVGASYCKENHHALKTIVRHQQPKEYIHVPEYASHQEPAPIYELQYQTESQEQEAQSQVAHHEPADHEIQLSTAKQPAPAYHYVEQEEHKPVHFHHGISLQSLYKQAAAHQAPATHQYQSHHEPSHYESHYSHDEQSQHAPQHHVASHHVPSHHAAQSDDQSHHAPQHHTASHHAPSHHAAHSDDLSHHVTQHHVASHHVPSQHAAHSEESHEEPIDYYAHPKYQYEYKVEDPHTGDNKFQHEVRDGDYVKGVYSFAEADGSIRTVEYTSDKHHGFNAVVKHTAPRQHQHQHGHEHHQN